MAKPKKKKSPPAKKTRVKKKTRFSFSSLVVPVMKWGLVASLWIFLGVGLLVAWYAAELPRIVESMEFHRRAAITIQTTDGETITRYGELKEAAVTVDELPAYLPQAVVAIEDRRFYSHFGMDPLGLLRAAAVNIRAGRIVQGGSTITQQLAKNLFLTRERTYKRKIQEALLALWLERELTKDEIMTAYLNRVYLGAGTYGVEAAAQTYFNKSAREVDLQEAAILAGLLRAPSRYAPSSNREQAEQRAAVVLQAMREAGYLSATRIEAQQSLVPFRPSPAVRSRTERYYTDWVLAEVERLIGTPDRDLYVETSFRPEIQRAAEDALIRALDEHGADRNISQGAIIVMDTDGAVLAMVGGRDHGASQFNRTTQAKRPPGSAFKPIVFLAALEAGWNPHDLIEDSPIETGRYTPANYNAQYYGDVPLSFALSQSLNTASVRLARSVGLDPIIHTAINLGIRTRLNRDLSLTLGSSGVPMIEMATAYATLANHGVGVDPYSVIRITDKSGMVLYERRNRPVELQVVQPDSVDKLTTMLREVIEEGTGRRAAVPYFAVGKTGTSQDSRDAWFLGYAGPFAAGVWLGNDDNTPMKGVTGGGLPSAIWRDVMMATAQDAESRGIQMPPPSAGPYARYNYQARSIPARTARMNEAPRSFGDVLRNVFSRPSYNE